MASLRTLNFKPGVGKFGHFSHWSAVVLSLESFPVAWGSSLLINFMSPPLTGSLAPSEHQALVLRGLHWNAVWEGAVEWDGAEAAKVGSWGGAAASS